MADENDPRPGDLQYDLVRKILRRLDSITPGGTTGALTDAQLRASPISVTVTGGGGLTNAELRASPVPVSGTVTATGPLTDAQLRATAVPVSGPLTDTQLRATAVPVSGTVTATGPLTDAQLRATAVPVSGTVTATYAATSGSFTNRSGTMTAGGTSQQVMAANATRKYLLFQNVSTENMWVNFGTAAVATQPSILIVPQGSFVMEFNFVENEAMNVISATTGSAYTAKEA